MDEQGRQAGAVDRLDAGEPDSATDVTSPLDQVDGQCALVDAAGLADVAVVEADEVGAFTGHVGEQYLVADERCRRRSDEFVEVGLVVDAVLDACVAHSSPPKTSMFENLQAGEACPVPMTWFSSPLPQFGVPITVKLSRLATPLKLRQKVEEMPR